MLKHILLLISFITSFPCFASNTTTTIDKILYTKWSMLVYVYPEGGIPSPPSCHGSNGDYYSFSIDGPMAKEYLAALMSAQARQSSVWLVGHHDCIDQSVSETLNYFQVND